MQNQDPALLRQVIINNIKSGQNRFDTASSFGVQTLQEMVGDGTIIRNDDGSYRLFTTCDVTDYLLVEGNDKFTPINAHQIEVTSFLAEKSIIVANGDGSYSLPQLTPNANLKQSISSYLMQQQRENLKQHTTGLSILGNRILSHLKTDEPFTLDEIMEKLKDTDNLPPAFVVQSELNMLVGLGLVEEVGTDPASYRLLNKPEDKLEQLQKDTTVIWQIIPTQHQDVLTMQRTDGTIAHILKQDYEPNRGYAIQYISPNGRPAGYELLPHNDIMLAIAETLR